MKKLFTLFLSLSVMISQGQFIWQQIADLPYAAFYQSSFVIDSLAYVGLGSPDCYHENFSDKFFKYNPVVDNWTQLNDFPGGGRFGATAFSINGKGYVCFGRNDSQMWTREVWRYDPLQDNWTRLNDFPGEPRYHAVAFVIDSFAYIVGGSKNEGYNYLNDVWRYNPVNDTWIWINDLPTEHISGAASVSLDGNGYVLGGLYNSDSATNNFFEYTPFGGTWIQLDDFPEVARCGPSAFVFENMIVVGTGIDVFSMETFSSFWAFDPLAENWFSIAGLPLQASPRYGATGFSMGNSGFIVGGISEYYLSSQATILHDGWKLVRYLGTDQEVAKDTKDVFVIYPNPGEGLFRVRSSTIFSSELIIKVFDIYGNIITTIRTDASHSSGGNLNLTSLNSGVYIAEIYAEGLFLQREKIIIQK